MRATAAAVSSRPGVATATRRVRGDDKTGGKPPVNPGKISRHLKLWDRGERLPLDENRLAR